MGLRGRGDYDWTMSNDLPRFEKEISALTDGLIRGFRQPNAALLATIGP